MSTTVAAPPNPSGYLTSLGLGFSIAIAMAFLVLLSAILLASYICFRASRNSNNYSSWSNNAGDSSTDGIILPRIVFFAEDDNEQGSAIAGLEQAVINSYPKFQFSKAGAYDTTANSIDNYGGGGDGGGCGGGNDNNICSICLCEYKDSEMLRMMPECRHYFHVCCIDAWLKLNGSCPVCRNSPLPTPLSTPLAEVVPLSQYMADRRRRT